MFVTRIAFYQTCLYCRYNNLYGNNPIVFITKQITRIQSNTKQVYFNSVVYPDMSRKQIDLK